MIKTYFKKSVSALLATLLISSSILPSLPSYAETLDESAITAPSAPEASTAEPTTSAPAPAVASASENSTESVKLQVINLRGNEVSHESEFYIRQEIPAAANAVVSGDGVELRDPWFLITVPKLAKKEVDNSFGEPYEYYSPRISKPNYVDSQNAYKSEFLEDNENYYIIYKFDLLTGGSNSTFPFRFYFYDHEDTKNGEKLEVKFQMLQGKKQEDNTTIEEVTALPSLYEASKIYTAKRDEVRIGEGYLSVDGYQGDRQIGLLKEEGKTTTGQEGYEVRITTGENIVFEESYDSNKSYYTPVVKSARIEYELPEYAEFVSSRSDNYYKYENAVAKLDPNRPNVVTWSIENIKPSVNLYGNPDLSASTDSINFVNAPIFEADGVTPKVYPITAKYWVTYEDGTEKQLPDIKREISFYLYEPTIDPPYSNTNITRRAAPYTNYTDGSRYNVANYRHTGNYLYAYEGRRIYDLDKDISDIGLPYTISVSNYNNFWSKTPDAPPAISKIWEVSDAIEDKGQFYKAFFIDSVSATGGDYTHHDRDTEAIKQALEDTPNALYGILSDDSTELLAENIKLAQKIDINDATGKYKGLKLTFGKPLQLNNQSVTFAVKTGLLESELDKFETKANEVIHYNGTSEVLHKIEFADSTTPDENPSRYRDSSNYNVVSIKKPTLALSPENPSRKQVYYKTGGTNFNEYSSFTTNVSSGLWGNLAYEELSNVKMIRLLPTGFDYKPEVIGELDDPEDKPYEVSVEQNFRNTGRTAVIYSFKSFTPKQYYSSVNTEIIATKYAERGDNLLETFLVYDNNAVIQPTYNSQAYLDQLDLDNDGDRTEGFIRTGTVIEYIPPLELLVKKQVASSKEETANWSNLVAIDMGEDFYYRIKVLNNTIADAEDLAIIDALPYKGDHYIVSNNEGAYLSRESQFSTPLSGAIEDIAENAEILAKFDVFYKTVPQGATLESQRDNDWLTKDEVSDFSEVKSLKFVLKKGQVLETKKEAVFLVKAKLPYDGNLKDGVLANNSAAISTNGRSYSEGNVASVTFRKYLIGGTVFRDLDGDGLIREDEAKEGIANRKVELLDADTGEIATEQDGRQIAPTVTDDKGQYQFEVLKRGKYKVRFTKLEKEIFTPKNFDNNFKASNAETLDGNSATSYAFNVTPEVFKAVQNVGILSDKRNVEIFKYYNGVDDKKFRPLEGAELELVNQRDESLKFKAVTGKDGKIEFKDVPFGTYTLKETKVPVGYNNPSPEGLMVEIDGNLLKTVKYENTQIRRNVSAKVVDKETGEPISSGAFRLVKKGSTSDTGKHYYPEQDGTLLFKDIPYGEYEVIEVGSPDKYKSRGNEKLLLITVESMGDETLDAGKIPYEKLKADVTLIKVDKEDRRRLEGAEFVLVDQNLITDASDLEKGEVMKAISDKNGLVRFKDVPAGSYFVIEKKAPEGYELTADNYDYTGVKGLVHYLYISDTDEERAFGEVANPRKEGYEPPKPPTVSTGGGTSTSSLPKDLNHKDHMRYVYGYPNGDVRPNGNITRAEVTSIFYRLLTDERRDDIFTTTNGFSDVKTSNWYNKAVSSMSQGAYIKGYPNNTFGGDRSITRAEFVAITARFLSAKQAGQSFKDVSQNHWAKEAIETGAAYGWLSGYEDGTFRPDQAITRAEVMAIINRLLDRGVDENGLKQVEYKNWPDNPKGSWYYYEVIEATNDHKHTGKRPNEIWTGLKIERVYDYEKYEKPNK